MTALEFFNGGRNSDGRTLDEILAWGDDDLERHHDVVQWCFPLHERSGFNPDAPVVTEREGWVLAESAAVRVKMRKVLVRWLEFYGFELKGEKVVRGKEFGEKSELWNVRVNHNHLRITRIIRSLRLFGLEGEAKGVYEAFAGFAESGESEIDPTAVTYWKEALRGGLFAPIRPR